MSDMVVIRSKFEWLIEIEAGPAKERQRVQFRGGAESLEDCIRDYRKMATLARLEVGVGQQNQVVQ